jgi:hypothetical protein
MQFSVYQESHIGGRKVNQDRMGYSFTREALLLVLADGMGGHLRGEIAASVALQTISTLFQQQAQPYVKKPQRFLEEALLAAHTDIHQYRRLGPLRRLAPVLDARWPYPRPHARPLARGEPDRQRPGAAVRARHPPGPQQAVELPRRRLRAARGSGRRCRAVAGRYGAVVFRRFVVYAAGR